MWSIRPAFTMRWLLDFRSANRKQGSLSSKKKILNLKLKGFFDFRLYLLHLPL